MIVEMLIVPAAVFAAIVKSLEKLLVSLCVKSVPAVAVPLRVRGMVMADEDFLFRVIAMFLEVVASFPLSPVPLPFAPPFVN